MISKWRNMIVNFAADQIGILQKCLLMSAEHQIKHKITSIIRFCKFHVSRSQWPRGQRHRSAAARSKA
jgi:hypothetical protein